MLTERQKKILKLVAEEHIRKAEPISSGHLKEKYNLDISAPTVRIEMSNLTNSGYLYQPHTSGGRVPTNKGYRFLVDDIFGNESNGLIDKRFLKKLKERQFLSDDIKFVRHLTKLLADCSSNFVLTYLHEERLFLEEGLQEVFKEPEFQDWSFCFEFIKTIKNLEKEIENLGQKDFIKIKVIIGGEDLLSKTQNLSLLISTCSFPKRGKGVVSILGPKRMRYDRNIKLVNSVLNLLEIY